MIVRELLALIGFEVDEQSLLKAENAFEAIAVSAFKLDQAIQKLGNIGTGAFQELEYAARQSGIGVQELGQRMAYFGRAINEALTTGGRPGRSFYQLFGGESIQILKRELGPGGGGMPAILGLVADKFNTLTDATKKDAIAIGLFSQGGAQMVPFLSQGSAAIVKWGIEARKTGIIMNEGMVKQGIELYHLLIQLEASLKGLTYAVLGPFLERFNRMIASFATWIQQHREIIAYRVGNVIEAIGKAFEFAAYAAEHFTKTMAIVSTIILATMFPMTAFFTSLFLIAEDLYKYFAEDDKDSITYLIILAFQAISKMLGEMDFGDILSAVFTNALAAARAFFNYLEEKAGMGGGATTSTGWSAVPGLGGYIMYLINQMPGISQLVKSMGGDPNDPSQFVFKHDIFGGGVRPPIDPSLGAGWEAPSKESMTFNPQIIINAVTSAPTDIASAVRTALDEWWYNQMNNSLRH